MHHALSIRMIVRASRALVANALARAISREARAVAAVRAVEGLDVEKIDRHGPSASGHRVEELRVARVTDCADLQRLADVLERHSGGALGRRR